MLFLILLSLLSPAPDVNSKDVNSKDLVHRLESRYRSAKTLQATFLQRYLPLCPRLSLNRPTTVDQGIATP